MFELDKSKHNNLIISLQQDSNSMIEQLKKLKPNENKQYVGIETIMNVNTSLKFNFTNEILTISLNREN